MKTYLQVAAYSLATTLLFTSLFGAAESEYKGLPNEMQKIMNQPKYEHAIWGLYAKDLQTGQVLFDLNSNKLFSPASTTKLFSIAALLNTFGEDYRFKTPVYATEKIVDGKLKGDLIIVAQGDLTMGGRQPNADTIAFTKMDHTIANNAPGVILTPEDPLKGINDLAQQTYNSGLRELSGDVFIDDSIFETTEKRDTTLSPMMINENLIDIVINPSGVGENAKLTWRPQVPGYSVDNQVKTVAKDGVLSLEITSDDSGEHFIVKGTIPLGQKDIVRTAVIDDPNAFARAAFIQALKNAGVKVNVPTESSEMPKPLDSFKNRQQVALWTSPPLTEYAKLVLKVSHNTGANLVPLLLASRTENKTFEEGLQLIGKFIMDTVKLSPNEFVILDGAGGNDNRFTPQAEVKLLEYMHKQAPEKFQSYMNDLPVLGVDGSLEDFAKNTDAVGKVFAKPGTGIAFNAGTGKLFLITQALGGYVKGKNGHIIAYMLAVNNGEMPTIDDIFAIFEDVSQLSSVIYDNSGKP